MRYRPKMHPTTIDVGSCFSTPSPTTSVIERLCLNTCEYWYVRASDLQSKLSSSSVANLYNAHDEAPKILEIEDKTLVTYTFPVPFLSSPSPSCSSLLSSSLPAPPGRLLVPPRTSDRAAPYLLLPLQLNTFAIIHVYIFIRPKF